MESKELIIRIIQEDFKYNQLILGLDNLHLQASEFHHLRLLDIVSDLMGVTNQLEFEWGFIYTRFLNRTGEYQIQGNSDDLRPLAESCYEELCTLLVTH